MRFSDIEIGVNQPATGQPVISDLTPREGLQLTVNTAAIADANGLGAFGYQWKQSIDGVTWGNIAGATAATFTPDDNAGQVFGDQAGLRLRVAVSFTDGGGAAEQVVSNATGPTGVNWAGNGANNTLIGTAGDDLGNGGGGNDTLSGNAGADILNGGGANDTLSGGLGNETLGGGAGADLMTGGAGNDGIEGDGGADTAIFVGGIGNFGLDSDGTTIVVTDNTAAEGVDTVLTTAVLRFNGVNRSEENTSELQSLMSNSYAVFCLKQKTQTQH